MSRRPFARTGLVALAALAALAGAVGPGARAATAADGLTIAGSDVTGYPTVVLDVDAPTGAFALAPSDVIVTENGDRVDATVTRLADDGLEVLLLIDTSGSMAGSPMTQAKAAARQFLDRLPAEVRVGLVGFGDAVQVLSPPTSDRVAVSSLIGALKPSGETTLYDAVVAARDAFTAAVRERVVVVLSDGGDTRSGATIDEAAAAVAGLHVEVVSLQTPSTNALALARLAIDGHGKVVSAADPAGLGAAYGTIAQGLLNRYKVTYPSRTGGNATVVVATPVGTAQARLDLPKAAPAPTTAAPAPTTAAPASVATAPPAPVPTTVAAPAAVTEPSFVDDAPWLLVVGGIACFAGFALVAVMLLPGPFTARRRRRQLGIERDLPQVELSNVAERAVGMAERVLQKGNRTEKIADLLEVAGVALRPAEFVALVAGVVVLALLFGLLLGGPVVGVVLAVLALLMSFGLLDVKGQRRRTRFAEHLPDVLQLLVSSLRTGYGLGQAVDAVSQDAPEPIAAEFRRVTVETRLGRDLSEALDGVGRRMRSPDFEMVVAAVRIHRTVGGNLAEIMANVGGTIRDRQRTARQVQALIGEGKLSAYILTALPVLLGLFMKLRNPEYFGALLHGGGLIALTLSGGLLVVGWLWFQKLVRIKF